VRVIGFFDGGLPDLIALDKLAELPGGEEMLHTRRCYFAQMHCHRAGRESWW
jgi:hypothetical protein